MATKFYLKHRSSGLKTVIGFGSDQIRTLVSMLTDSSNRLIMGKCCEHLSAVIFDWIFFILTDNKDNHYISNELEIRQNPTTNWGVKSFP